MEEEDRIEIEESDNAVDPLNAETVDTVVDEDNNLIAGEEEVVKEENFFSNLAENIDDQDLKAVAIKLLEDYKNDKMSRKDWVDNYVKGLDLVRI